MEQKRTSVSSGSPFEPQVGFCRAIRVGGIIAVSGTAPLSPEGFTVGTGDVAAQTRRCFEIIADALERLGSSISDVVRTRVFLSRIDDWKQVAEVHGEFFRNIRPAATFVQVTRFIDPDWLVEIEADAVIATTDRDVWTGVFDLFDDRGKKFKQPHAVSIGRALIERGAGSGKNT
jgi:enamine deaminase RidA (YjgF/YER057c/UK114 family)